MDDQPRFREGVAHWLGTEPDSGIVGQGTSADDAVSLARDLSATCSRYPVVWRDGAAAIPPGVAPVDSRTQAGLGKAPHAHRA